MADKKKSVIGGRPPRTHVPEPYAEPTTFRLLPGGNYEHRAKEGDEVNDTETPEGSVTQLEPGDTVTCKTALDKLFVNRFEILPRKKKKLKKVEEEEDLDEEEAEIEEEEVEDEEPAELDEDDALVEKMNENDEDDVPAKKTKKKKKKKTN